MTWDDINRPMGKMRSNIEHNISDIAFRAEICVLAGMTYSGKRNILRLKELITKALKEKITKSNIETAVKNGKTDAIREFKKYKSGHSDYADPDDIINCR